MQKVDVAWHVPNAAMGSFGGGRTLFHALEKNQANKQEQPDRENGDPLIECRREDTEYHWTDNGRCFPEERIESEEFGFLLSRSDLGHQTPACRLGRAKRDTREDAEKRERHPIFHEVREDDQHKPEQKGSAQRSLMSDMIGEDAEENGSNKGGCLHDGEKDYDIADIKLQRFTREDGGKDDDRIDGIDEDEIGDEELCHVSISGEFMKRGSKPFESDAEKVRRKGSGPLPVRKKQKQWE
jgi:hypothetical protein